MHPLVGGRGGREASGGLGGDAAGEELGDDVLEGHEAGRAHLHEPREQRRHLHAGEQLGAGDRVNRHAASLLECAKNKNVAQLKKELSSTQRDVEAELVSLRDADLAHLISLGGWIRALEVSTVAVDKQFSVERARKVMREDIADYYTESVAGLEPRISERPNYIAMRDLLAGLRTEMVLEDGKEPTPELMAEIRKQAAKLVELALQRQQ